MKKGFTLIELLAVIVILAIIALIATPIVLNIINNVKESASLRSAEMYLNGVEQAIMRENMDGTFNPVYCEINENGNLECDGNPEEVKVEVDGEKPIEGNINFEEGKISKSIIAYENNVSFQKNKDGEIKDAKFCKLEDGEGLTRGAKYTCDPGDGVKRIFYLLEYDNETGEVQLIMDRNLEEASAWNSEDDPSEPRLAMESLRNQTKNWKNVSVDLPTKEQVESLDTSSRTDVFLIENLGHPANMGEFIEAFYWTKTSYCSTQDCWSHNGSYTAWCVIGDSFNEEYDEYMYETRGATYTDINQVNGIRPVITISKYNLY